MWRFHKYYLKELLLNLTLTFVMLFGVALLALLARGISKTQGQDMILALWVTLLWAIDTVPDLLSISILIATVFTFGRAAADNEITAIRMAGVSPLRLIGSVLIVGAMTAGLNTFLVHNLIPYVHYEKYRPFKNLMQKFIAEMRPSNNQIRFSSRLSMSWRKAEKRHYYDVTIKAEGRDRDFEGFAGEAWFTQQGRRFLLLRIKDYEGFQYATAGPDGMREQQTIKGEGPFKITFDLEELMEKGKRAEGVKDMPTEQLVAEYGRGGSPNPPVTRWIIWLRTMQGLASLFFALVAFPIGVLSRRSGRMAGLAFAMLPLAVYYTLYYLAPYLARNTGSVLPVALPSLVLFVLSQVLMRVAFRR